MNLYLYLSIYLRSIYAYTDQTLNLSIYLSIYILYNVSHNSCIVVIIDKSFTRYKLLCL